MKIVLWIGDGPNQIALANKIQSEVYVEKIFLEKKSGKRKLTVAKIIGKIVQKVFLNKIDKAWNDLQNSYASNNKPIDAIKVENINSQFVYDETKLLSPDLIIVSGTKLIKDKLLSLQPTIGIVNLHTGVSPFIKGGPNCTNWCIATNQFHLIGNSVMWIDLGIDSGNLIRTELTEFNGSESLLDVHKKVMDHAHQLYVEVIKNISKTKPKGVPQIEVGEGITYYTKQWGLKQRFKLLKNFKKFNFIVNSEEYKAARKKVNLVGD